VASAALLALASLPALSACSGAGATAAPASSATASPSAPVAPSVAPNAVPVGAADLDAATDFVLAWFQTLNYGLASGDADPLRQTTSLGCFTCAGWITQVQEQHDRAEHREGGLVTLRDAALAGMVGQDYVIRASLQQQPGQIDNGLGASRAVPAAGTIEIVDLQVGVTTASLDGQARWAMKAITPPR
jgi:hypothetical protein